MHNLYPSVLRDPHPPRYFRDEEITGSETDHQRSRGDREPGIGGRHAVMDGISLVQARDVDGSDLLDVHPWKMSMTTGTRGGVAGRGGTADQ